MKMKQGVLPYYILIVFIKGCEGNRRKTVGAFGNYFLSRLTGAAYSENGSASTHYGTSYQYDLPRSWGQGYDYHQIEELVIEYFVK